MDKIIEPSKEWCEECRKLEQSAHRRPEMGGRVLCSGCYYVELRKRSATGLVKVPCYLRVK